MPRYALSWSGGKDSMLALDRARRQGLEVACLFNIYDGPSGRVPFHGVRAELIAAQAAALGIPLVIEPTVPDDYETVLRRLFARFAGEGISGIVFGNLHLQDIHDWYDERVVAAGLEHAEPLWHEPLGDLLRELLSRGYRARIVSIDLKQARPEWLGRVFDLDLVRELEGAGIDPCGEKGEYHSFVFDGPLFRAPVAFSEGETVEMKGHRLLDLAPRPARA